MTTAFNITVQVGTPQSFNITLGGTTYEFTLQYRNDPAGLGGWCLDIADRFGNAIVQGIPLVTGINLLAQYGYLNIGNGGGLWVQTTDDPDAVPTFENLGSSGQIYWVTA